jgi:hypothetical protein
MTIGEEKLYAPEPSLIVPNGFEAELSGKAATALLILAPMSLPGNWSAERMVANAGTLSIRSKQRKQAFMTNPCREW